mmetsp:Transcript_112256/g.223086  ORF Transcript_112256/g.223086 Transcript_112256/m.223086 type:complete len:81 (-) Transcript_112256:290-532(-)
MCGGHEHTGMPSSCQDCYTSLVLGAEKNVDPRTYRTIKSFLFCKALGMWTRSWPSELLKSVRFPGEQHVELGRPFHGLLP